VFLFAILLNLPLAAQSLDFLHGVWFSAPGEPYQTIEFHLDTQHGQPIMIGREWASHESPSCPWCVADAAFAFSADTNSKQLIVHLRNREGRTAELPLVQAHKWYLQFQSPEHVLIVELRRPNDLVITGDGGSRVAFHRH
jgi:hypothetical protein